MDNQAFELLMAEMSRTHADLTEVKSSLVNLEKSIVGIDHCTQNRAACEGRFSKHDERIRALEDRSRLVDLTWKTVRGNQVLMTSLTMGALGLVGVYSGRILELITKYGVHVAAMAAILIIFVLSAVLAWNNPKETKKMLRL